MNTDQQSQALAKLFEMQAQIISDTKKDKEALIVIILEKTDAETRLGNLRRALLEHQIQKKEDPTVDQDPNLTISSVFSKVTELSIDEMERVTDTMRTMTNPIMSHRRLMDSIAEVLRTSELPSNIKIDRISDLLL